MTMHIAVPIERTMSPRTFHSTVRGWLRLFVIEMRRSPALWAGIAIAAISAWLMYDVLPVGVVRWGDVSYSAGYAMIPSSAIAAGIGAFVAGRDDRLRLGDQLIQTASGTSRREVLALLATLVWCLAGYLVAVAGFFLYAAMKATWGGPTWGSVYLTVATIALGVAGGWLVGTIFRHRLSSLVVAAAALGVHGFYPLSARFRMVQQTTPDGMSTPFMAIEERPWRHLFPYELRHYYDLTNFMGRGVFWLIGVAIVLVCLAWAWRYRNLIALGTALLALMVSIVPASSLVRRDVEPSWMSQSSQYVQPVCEARLDGQIEICMHPQDEALLDDTAGSIAVIVAPVAGLPGVPTRYEQEQLGLVDDDVVSFYVQDETSIPTLLYGYVLPELVQDPSRPLGYEMGSAQYVIGAWLLQEAGVSREAATQRYTLSPLSYVQVIDEARAAGVTDHVQLDRYLAETSASADLAGFESAIVAAIDRFAALTSEDRRAWLDANWDALRAGELTLEDLP